MVLLMKALAQVDKALSEIMYSVIEKGVCRIVTSQKSKLLDELKAAYPANLPQNHRLVWLPGNIQSIEQLSQVLIAAGVPGIQPEFDADALAVQIQAHLTRCHRQHKLEIWIFEDAELLAEEIFQLLGNLISTKNLNKALFSLELWGNAQLDVLYHSGDLTTCCGAQHYYIPVGEQILTNTKPAKTTRLLIPGALLLILGIGLGSVVNVWVISGGHTFSQEKSQASVKVELINALKADKAAEPKPKSTYKPIDRSQAEVTADSPTKLVVQSTPEFNSDNTMGLIAEHTQVIKFKDTVEQLTEQTLEFFGDNTADHIVDRGHVQTAGNTTKAISEQTSEVRQEDSVDFIVEHTQILEIEDPAEQLKGLTPEIMVAHKTSLTDEQTSSATGYIKTELRSTTSKEHIASADFKQHWFFSLAFFEWREKYQIELADEVDRQAGTFFLQLGLYRRQQSLTDFFVAEDLPAETYYFCYQKKNNMMALITGSYDSLRQAYNAHNELQIQGFASYVISVNQLNDWQCSS
jgi:hypothetical protein